MQKPDHKGTVSEADLLAPEDEKALILTNKLLFQNAITHGMSKSTALGIALNSIKSPVT